MVEGAQSEFHLIDHLILRSIGKQLHCNFIKLNYVLVTFWFSNC